MLSRYTLYYKLLLVSLLLCSIITARGQDKDPHITYKVKHITSFANYTTWPTLQSESFVIGVIESEVYYEEIKQFYEGQKIKNKTVLVQLYKAVPNTLNCNLLFIPKSFEAVDDLLNTTRGKPILIIGNNIKTNGIHINFSLANGEIIYELNPKAYNIANLQVDYYFQKTSRIFTE